MKAVQMFSKEYLELCKTLTPEQIIKFVDDFRKMYGKVHLDLEKKSGR